MKQIALSTTGKKYKGLYSAMVDDENYDLVKDLTWSVMMDNNTQYAYTQMIVNGVRKPVKMHRFILGVTDPKIKVDHGDSNGLNNQKHNLRTCTHQQNMGNQNKRKNCSSKYKGVRHKKQLNIWEAYICSRGEYKHLGYFKTEIEAAKEYDKAAIESYGEFAKLNLK